MSGVVHNNPLQMQSICPMLLNSSSLIFESTGRSGSITEMQALRLSSVDASLGNAQFGSLLVQVHPPDMFSALEQYYSVPLMTEL